MQSRKINLLNTLDHLQAGDVLLFRSVHHLNLGQRIIGLYQSLTSHAHGHYETVHAGICVGKDENGPVIAHVTGGKHFSYVKQSILESNREDQESRSLIIFRHKDQDIRELIAVRALAIGESINKPKWTFSAAFKSILLPAKKSQSPEEIAQSSICSKFTIQVLQQATKSHESYLNISSDSSPKALESALYNNAHYNQMLYTGSPNPRSKWGVNPYFAIQHSIEKEVDRLTQQTNNKYAMEKSNKLKAALLKSAQSQLNSQDYALEKAEQLLKDVLPVLETNTGFGFQTPTSYKNVAAEARKLGLFQMKATPTAQQNKPLSTYAYSAMLRR